MNSRVQNQSVTEATPSPTRKISTKKQQMYSPVAQRQADIPAPLYMNDLTDVGPISLANQRKQEAIKQA